MTGTHDNNRISLPKTAGPLWLRAFVALLFVFHINYVPFHLAAETHLDDWLASLSVEQSHTDCGLEANDAHGDTHRPHLAADHSIKLTPQMPSGFVILDAVAADLRVPQLQSQPCFRLFLTERQNPPGKFTPGPAQPRAPPLA